MRRFAFSGLIPLVRQVSVAIPREVREKFSQVFAKVKEEAKGQACDLEDMSEAARASLKMMQDLNAPGTARVEDKKLGAKVLTVTASLKAYNTRLRNLQNEAKGIQADVDSAMRVLWGKDVEPQQESATQQKEEEEEVVEEALPKVEEPGPQVDFGIEPPRDDTVEAKHSAVPIVEGEVIRDDPAAKKKGAQEAKKASEIEVEVESVDNVELESTAETMPIPEITKALHEQGVDFSDCMDARSLRVRYQEFLDGKFTKPATPPPSSPAPEKRHSTRLDDFYSNNQQQQSTADQYGVIPDPHPGAMRKQVDGMKFVHEVKAEIAREQGANPNDMDLWAGWVKLEDHKRMYEYQTVVQNQRIDVRRKGDKPPGA